MRERLFSVNMSSIGRSTHKAGTAAAHIKYVANQNDAELIAGGLFPSNGNQAAAWIKHHENAIRKNGRVCTKIRICLPRDLNPKERSLIVHRVADRLGDSRASWFAGLHDNGPIGTAYNPHAHLVFVDADVVTGARVAFLSDSAKQRQARGLGGVEASNGDISYKSTDYVRQLVEEETNRLLERRNLEGRVNRMTLERQGIDRMPQIHIGPKAFWLWRYVTASPASKLIEKKRWNYTEIKDYEQWDGGLSRYDQNQNIINFNLERARRSDNPKERAIAELYHSEHLKDQNLENEIAKTQRRRTFARKRASRDAQVKMAEIRKFWDQNRARLKAEQTRRYQEKIDLLQQRFDQEQGFFRKRIMRYADLTGQTRTKQNQLESALSRLKEQSDIFMRMQQKAIDAEAKAQMTEVMQDLQEQRQEIDHDQSNDIIQANNARRERADEKTTRLQVLYNQLNIWQDDPINDNRFTPRREEPHIER